MVLTGSCRRRPRKFTFPLALHKQPQSPNQKLGLTIVSCENWMRCGMRNLLVSTLPLSVSVILCCCRGGMGVSWRQAAAGKVQHFLRTEWTPIAKLRRRVQQTQQTQAGGGNLQTRELRNTKVWGNKETAGGLVYLHSLRLTNVAADTVPHHRGGGMLKASSSIQLGMYVGGRSQGGSCGADIHVHCIDYTLPENICHPCPQQRHWNRHRQQRAAPPHSLPLPPRLRQALIAPCATLPLAQLPPRDSRTVPHRLDRRTESKAQQFLINESGE